MLIKASWVEAVQKLLGLTSVSQVWGKKPSWYLWISEAPGVLHPQIERVGSEKIGEDFFHSALLSLKCYPFIHSDMFPLFSFEEQSFIQSEYFDESNTPRFEFLDQMPENLFNIAAVEYMTDIEDTIAVFTLESLELMRSSFDRECIMHYPMLKQSKIFIEKTVDRRIPAAKLGYLFFDRLVGLYAFYSKRKPFRVVFSRTPGFEYFHRSPTDLVCSDANDIDGFSLKVFFVSEKARKPSSSLERLAGMNPLSDQEVLYDRVFSCGCIHDEPMQTPWAPGVRVPNPLWRRLAESSYKSSMSSSCGCKSS